MAALSGKTSAEGNGVSVDDKWSGDDWDYFHRLNLALKLSAGYGIPIGPIVLVPGRAYGIHLINDIDRKEFEDDNPTIDTDDLKSRYNALIITCAVEFGL